MNDIFPTLYKKTSTGAIQKWQISTTGNEISTVWGQIDGREQATIDIVREGKNIGKVNETTPEQQAATEAQAQWEKKLKKGYVKTPEDAQSGKLDEIIKGGVEPMLAHRYDEQGHKIKWPAFAQPKLDGHRCIAIVNEGIATLWTRTRKPITGLPHLTAQLDEMAAELAELNPDEATFVLDGELYVHSHRNNFEDLTSFIRTPQAKPGSEIVEYHVYDLVAPGLAYHERLEHLEHLMRTHQPNLIMVETAEVQDEDELMLAFDEFTAQGYEGCMVRNAAGKYLNKRSYDLLKVKEFQDSEFVVTGVEEGRGKLAGHAIFVCATADGTAFRAKMKGETSALKVFFDNPALAVGRQLTVKYQGITSKLKVPRFPVALRFRDDV